jgi:hypothetical protein
MSLFTQRLATGLALLTAVYMIVFYVTGLLYMYDTRGMTENRVKEDFLFASFWVFNVLLGLSLLGIVVFGPIIWISKKRFSTIQVRLSPSPART